MRPTKKKRSSLSPIRIATIYAIPFLLFGAGLIYYGAMLANLHFTDCASFDLKAFPQTCRKPVYFTAAGYVSAVGGVVAGLTAGVWAYFKNKSIKIPDGPS